MNQRLAQLQPYPFEKLAKLKAGIIPAPDRSPIIMSIGEPQHSAPSFVAAEIASAINGLAKYPVTVGAVELRQAIANWLTWRFALKQDALDVEQHILPVNGTREALFAFAQCVVEPDAEALVLMPNPFYQIYEGGAIMAGAKPWFINTVASTNFLPDFESIPEHVWQKCQLIYICSPGNPSGSVLDLHKFERLIELSDRYQFVIASDECYSEIYADENNPPPGLLRAAARLGRYDFRNCIVFHSLSKRSSLPGMRSGFVAGDANIIKAFRLYRTYHGSAMSPPYQAASIKAWSDENHVRENRKLYRDKFATVLRILQPVTNVSHPDGGFYLWIKTPVDDTVFAKELYRRYNLTVLPGSYLARNTNAGNPGQNYIRLALVASLAECTEAAERLRDFFLSW